MTTTIAIVSLVMSTGFVALGGFVACWASAPLARASDNSPIVVRVPRRDILPPKLVSQYYDV
jgi:hypothetical protein